MTVSAELCNLQTSFRESPFGESPPIDRSERRTTSAGDGLASRCLANDLLTETMTYEGGSVRSLAASIAKHVLSRADSWYAKCSSHDRY